VLSRPCRLLVCCLFAAILVTFPANAFSADQPARWIVITAPAFRQAIEPLRQRRVGEGFNVTLTTTTDILSPADIQHGNGGPLRDYLNDLYKQPSGKTYVLLVGVARSANTDEPLAE
jgi:hypothetical protein